LAGKSQSVEPAFGAESLRAGATPPRPSAATLPGRLGPAFQTGERARDTFLATGERARDTFLASACLGGLFYFFVTHNNFKKSSTSNRACFKMCANAERLTGRCAGTVIFSTSLPMRFCNRM